MTVGELIERLKEFPLDEEIFIATDGHGLGHATEISRNGSHEGAELVISDYVETPLDLDQEMEVVECPRCESPVEVLQETVCACGYRLSAEEVRFQTSQIP